MTSPARPMQVDIAGVHVDAVDFAATLDHVERWIGAPVRECRQICTVNPEFIVDAQSNPEFAAALARADLRVPDGIGIVWAMRLQGVTQRERVTGSDGIYHICARAAAHGWRVFLLGAAPGVAERAATKLCVRYATLQICGVHSGSPSSDDWPAIQTRLAELRPQILLVAFGHPKQDLWIDRHRAELPVDVAIGVGGAFDFVAGIARRAPRWVQRLGLEWFYRLLREPWRWRRMIKLPLFVLLVARQQSRRRTRPMAN